MRVIHGGEQGPRRTALEDAYDHFRLERQGNRVSPKTLLAYDYHLGLFFDWLRRERPAVRRFPDLAVDDLRAFRAEQATRVSYHGRPLEPETLQSSHGHLRAFLRWADDEGYPVDPKMLRLPRIRVPAKEPTIFHIAQLRKVLAACNETIPTQELSVRILVGSGLRVSELVGLCAVAPDGLSDLMLDSMDRGRAELRVRGAAGAKGRKSRRVPIHPKLAAAIKRYQARHRPDVETPALLVNLRGVPFRAAAIDTLLDRIQLRVGFRVHAHAFRHTFATVATQMGWNFERLRAAMGHADYNMLQRYVHLATERDLGRERDWEEFILPATSLGGAAGANPHWRPT